MSEHLTKMVQKIDFSKIGSESEDTKISLDGIDGTAPEDDSKELATFQPSLWPFDSVRNKLKYCF